MSKNMLEISIFAKKSWKSSILYLELEISAIFNIHNAKYK